MACYSPIAVTINPLLEYRRIVPCGKCVGCLQKRRADWTFRIMQQEHEALHSCFLTLTYNDEFLPIVNGQATLDKKELQNYFKKVRKEEKGLKYYAVGEYGSGNNRPHYHAIVFDASNEVLAEKWSQYNQEKEAYRPKGRISQDQVTLASVHYVTKYMIQGQSYGYYRKVKPFAIMSKGLGKNYLEKNSRYHLKSEDLKVYYPGGSRQGMPRYYKEKIFTEDQLKRLHLIQGIENNRFISENGEMLIQQKHNKIYRITKNSKSKKV